jgi:MraZ protein
VLQTAGFGVSLTLWGIVGYRGEKWETTPVLLGEYQQRLDAKNRLTLPAKLRSYFAEGAVVTKGFDGCLLVFPRGSWNSFVEARLERLDPFSKESRRLSRWFYAGANECELDGQGRIMLTQPLLQHGKVEKDVVVAGARDYLEVWDAETWSRVQAESEGSVEDVAERLSQP